MDELTRRFLKSFMVKIVPSEKSQNKKDSIDTISETVLDIFVDATFYYMKCITKQATNVAEHAGRTEVHAGDVFDALWNYHENVESLCQFIVDFPKVDTIQVSPYPIELSETVTPGDYPYRADAIVEFAGENQNKLPPHVPQFLPAIAESNFDDITEFNDPSIEVTNETFLAKINVGNCPLVDTIIQSLMAKIEQEQDAQ
ncbi:hypothetical protein TVAG_394500 [Trichomonas vaginalis G3]|uniref:Bromodomain associated domain-containing protein n=1 Tax=Trichomonas vaginalis (strain ATCC PRA-98 / G3) TaxID=412133 RepID=A2DWG6_TRIV3|nr:histone, subunit A domain-containing protein [Trichomonas vaginalis G3]EAY15306.1 hypothetical protein TVAG_394500 [Trichomonas vaginalis G3]KAI5536604.1 histone, subunit A domain-containing protein [Trichomonas vaginalis G3]|eukprot:XP_001327529.1 hypothetical protein [Trichomonas vaginalis G3]